MNQTHAPAGTPLVELRDIKVSFGGLHAVDGVSLTLMPGEVMAVVGGNGAGKSTLMHTIAGAHPADSGQILVNGSPVTIANPRDARLQYLAGMACLKRQLWGKAQSYLEASLAMQPTRAAHIALAQLFDGMGREQDATRHYRAAADAGLASGTGEF